MNPYILDLLLIFAAYLTGAIPFAVIVARAHGIDIFKEGSGNPGATNVGRVLGAGWGALVFVADALKGLLPVLVVRMICPADQRGIPIDHQAIHALVGFAAVAGHVTSPYIGFKGGKGVATAVGAVLGISPLVALSGLAVFGIVFAVTRYVSLASIVAVLAALPLAFLFRDPPSLQILYTIASFLIVWRHRTNIKRLLRGEESKYRSKVRTSESPAHADASSPSGESSTSKKLPPDPDQKNTELKAGSPESQK